MSSADEILRGLPAEELIREGLSDRASGRRTVAACLVELAAPRLGKAGLIDRQRDAGAEATELYLYGLLKHLGARAYSRYNSLLRELCSFERALDHRLIKRGQ